MTLALLPVPQLQGVKKISTAEFREMAKRWHPDKFMQLYGNKLCRPEAKDILDAVIATFQELNNQRV